MVDSSAGDQPWSIRFYEAILCGSIPIVKGGRARNAAERRLGYKYYDATKTDTFAYREDWARSNIDIFLRHQTYLIDTRTPFAPPATEEWRRHAWNPNGVSARPPPGALAVVIDGLLADAADRVADRAADVTTKLGGHWPATVVVREDLVAATRAALDARGCADATVRGASATPERWTGRLAEALAAESAPTVFYLPADAGFPRPVPRRHVDAAYGVLRAHGLEAIDLRPDVCAAGAAPLPRADGWETFGWPTIAEVGGAGMHFKRAPQVRRNLRGASNRRRPAAGPRRAVFSTPRTPALWDRVALVAALGRGGATDAARWTRAWTPADRVACVHYLFPQTHALAQLRRRAPAAPEAGRNRTRHEHRRRTPSTRRRLSPEARPNVLFLLADDLAKNAISAYESHLARDLQTPRIDSIAKEGALFLNAFVPNSLCTPSRLTILTGLHAHESGVRTLQGTGSGHWKHVAASAQSYPAVLRAAGYATAQAGKFAAGFERVGAAAFAHFRPFRELTYHGTAFCVGWPAACRPLPQNRGLESAAIAAELEAWIAAQTGPFYAEADFYAAHDPWGSDPSDNTKFVATHFAEPTSLYHDWGGAGAPGRVRAAAAAARREHVGLFDYKLGPTPAYRCRGCRASKAAQKLSAEKLRRLKRPPGDAVARRNATYQAIATVYSRTVLGLDRAVGRLLDAVEPARDSTVVVFASDQGIFLGEHGRVDKRLAYEEAMAFPLIIRYPPLVRPGSRVDALVASFDVGLTVLDLAGAAYPETYAARLPGSSLVPLLRGGARGLRTAHYYRYFQHHAAVPGHVAVRAGGLKLIFWYAHACRHVIRDDDATRPQRPRKPRGAWNATAVPLVGDAWELFDLEADPGEMRNVWAAPAYRSRRCEALIALLDAKHDARDDDERHCPESVQQGTALGAPRRKGQVTVGELCGT